MPKLYDYEFRQVLYSIESHSIFIEEWKEWIFFEQLHQPLMLLYNRVHLFGHKVYMCYNLIYK